MPSGRAGEHWRNVGARASVRLYAFLVLLAGALFALDLSLPLGIAASVGYVAVVMLSLWVPGRAITLWVACGCIALAIVGAVFSPGDAPLWNRCLSILALSAAAVLGHLRKLVQEDLRRSEQRFRALFAQSNDAVLVVDRSRDRILDANERALRMLVVERDALGTLPFSGLFPGQSDELSAMVDAAVAGQESVPRQLRCKTGGGELACEVSLSLVELDEDVCLQVVVRDVSERQRAEGAIRIRARQQAAVAQLGLRSMSCEDIDELFDAAVGGVAATLGTEYCKVLELLDHGRSLRLRAGAGWESSLTGDDSMVNDGCSPAGLTLRRNEPVIIENLRDDERFAGCQFLDDHGIVSGLSVIIHTDEQPFGVLGAHTASPRTFTEDDVNFLQTVANVLGLAIQRRRALDLVQESERRFRSLVEATSDWLWEVDRNGVYTYVSPKVEDLLGYSADEILGRTPVEMTAAEEAGRVAQALRQSVETAMPFTRVQRTTPHREGHMVVLEMSGVPIVDTDGTVIGLRGVDRDITERRRAAQQLEAAMEAAQDANRTKSLFLANMSHEIRTPMTAVLGFTESLLGGDLVGEERQQAIEIIRRNCRHLIDLVNDILDVSKIEAGMMRVESVPCSPAEIVADIASLMRASARDKLVAFEVRFDTPIPEVIATDPTRLRQILTNLIGNAVKFTDVGCVSLSVALQPGERLRFDIVDSGVGMSEAQTARLFQPFAQADISMTRRFGGTGLGLSISKKLAQMLGGDVVLMRSQPNAGSHFRVVIGTGPLAGVPMLESPDLANVSAPAAAVPPGDSLPECRVLLAEDGRDNQILVRHILQRAGAHVDIVDNGQAAVEQALAARDAGSGYDVILMDMQMPVMDGYEATASLRTRGYRGTIIALTANAMDGAAEACARAGCDDYASKPIDRRALLDKLRASVPSPSC